MSKKKLVIIAGISGAIGNAFLSEYAKENSTVIYGISRKALPQKSFINPETKKLYENSFVCSLENLSDNNITEFINNIHWDNFSSITYIHAIGLYPFEINTAGEHVVENDHDGDGINDLTMDLTYRVFKTMTSSIKEATLKHFIKAASIIFGSLADKHKPLVHKSWWQTIEKTKNYIQTIADQSFGIHILNISSVICSHEIITRPFVFINTDAEMKYWLSPTELTQKFLSSVDTNSFFNHFHEHELFNKKPSFDLLYYKDTKFTPRKVAELY